MAIKYGPWPIPLHRQCVCSQYPVRPGSEAMPFVDVREFVATLSHDQQVAAVGAANWRLIQSGVVTFADVIGAARVKPFYEVVAEFKLSLKEMLKAGVSPNTATRAYESVHTPAIELARKHAQELVERITRTGLTREQVARTVAERMVRNVRVNLVAPPTPKTAPPVAQIAVADVPELIQTLRQQNAGAAQRVAVGQATPAATTQVPRQPPPKTTTAKPQPQAQAEPQPQPPKFGESEAHVVLDSGVTEKRFAQTSQTIFGREVTPKDIASVVGAPDGAEVRIAATLDRFQVWGKGKGYKFVRFIQKDANGKIVITNNLFVVGKRAQNKGLGREIFGRQVENAVKQGIDRIETYAAKGEGFNGYYTWPRFGYDANLWPAIKAQLPKDLAGPTTLRELMSTEEGRTWWKKHGEAAHLKFDLAPDSPSRKAWDEYLIEKVKQAGEAKP